MEASTLDWKMNNEYNGSSIDKDVPHIGIRSRCVGRTDTGIDKPVVAVLKSWNIHSEDLLDMVRKTDFFDFDARIV